MANADDVARLKSGIREWNTWRQENPNYRPDLSGANLSWADLSTADLSETNLSRAYLVGTNLIGANLSGGNLSWADLTRAYLSGANLSRAYLIGTNLNGAHLSGADLSEANFSGTNLTKSILKGAFPLITVEPLLEVQAQQEEDAEEDAQEPEPTTAASQTILTTTPLADSGLTLFSVFVRLPHEVVSRNEPLLLDAFAEMEGGRVLIPEVTSFDEMAEALCPEGMKADTFRKVLHKALAEEYVVIAIRNPLVDFGKLLTDKVFPGGTVITSMLATGDMGTFFVCMGAGTAGLVIIRLGLSVAKAADAPIQALGQRLAQWIASPKDQPIKGKKKKPKKGK